MSNTLSKINLSKIGWEGGWSTLIWIMSLNILFFFLGSTPKHIRGSDQKRLKMRGLEAICL